MTDGTPSVFAFDVFVSYASADHEIVEPLVTRLKSDGFAVWWDVDQMIGGGVVFDQIADGIVQSAHMIVCLSDAYIERDVTAFELHTNQSFDPSNRKNRTIPVKVKSLTQQVPTQIRSFRICDLTNPESRDVEYRKLIAGIGARTIRVPRQESDVVAFQPKRPRHHD